MKIKKAHSPTTDQSVEERADQLTHKGRAVSISIPQVRPFVKEGAYFL